MSYTDRDRRLEKATMAMIALAIVFGGADQYLGSLSVYGWGRWTVAVSQMSATWLILPFIAGATTDRADRGVRLGLAVTYAGLLGYLAMTLSPVEGVSLPHVDFAAFLRSQWELLVGGVFTGALFGWLGFRWRAHRSWWSALLLALSVCGEPAARALVGRLEPPSVVWMVEIGLGVAMAVWSASATKPWCRTRA